MQQDSADAPFWSKGQGLKKPMLILLYALDSNGMKFWTDPALSVSTWLDYARRTFDTLYAEGGDGQARIMSLGLHLRIIGRPGRIGALDEFLEYACGHEGLWLATRREIAEHWQKMYPQPEIRPELRD